LDCHAAKRFFAQKGIEYDERDVTTSEKYMEELKELMGRFVTPTIVIGKEVLVGFAANRRRIEELVG
jgi:glutaredoxin